MNTVYDALFGFGFFVNIAGFGTMQRTWPAWARPGRTLLRLQIILDTMVCIVGYALVRAPLMWATGKASFDAFVCRLWHSEFLFWSHTNIATWNLLFLAIEQMMLAWTPEGMAGFDRRAVPFHLIFSFSMGYFINCPRISELTLVNGTCTHHVAFLFGTNEHTFEFASVIGVFVSHLLPILYIQLFIRHMCTARPSCGPQQISGNDSNISLYPNVSASRHVRKTSRGSTRPPIKPRDTVTDSSVWGAVAVIMMLVFSYGLSGVLHFANTGHLYMIVSDDKFSLVMMWVKSVFTTPLLLATIPTYRAQMIVFFHLQSKDKSLLGEQ